MLHKQPLLYQDPKITYPNHLGLNFSDYLQQCREIITHHRHDLSDNRDLKIDANCPFELKPAKQPHKKRYGALLIHGLFDSPFIMRDIGERLAAEGLLVRSILLPGHGTVPGALLNVTYESWMQTVQYGIAAFSKEVDQLFLVGYSLGGALAAHQASDMSDFIAGLIMLAPAFKIKSNLGFLTKWFCALGHYINRARWLYLREEIDYVKYHSIAFCAVNQVYQLTQKIKMQNNLPQFLALTLDDKTIDSVYGLNYFSNTTHPANRLILYANQHPNINDTRIIHRPASYPKQHILDIAHIGMTLSASNPHYGTEGDYPFASHAQDNKVSYLYDEITPIGRAIYDFLYKIKLTRHRRQRLTYNPDFEFMMREMVSFIGNVCS